VLFLLTEGFHICHWDITDHFRRCIRRRVGGKADLGGSIVWRSSGDRRSGKWLLCPRSTSERCEPRGQIPSDGMRARERQARSGVQQAEKARTKRSRAARVTRINCGTHYASRLRIILRRVI
jgi:hypothetical protein